MIKDAGVPERIAKFIIFYEDLNTVSDIKIRRLGRAGRIVRMEDGRIPNKVINVKFHNTRPVGKPRMRWEDVVRRDTSQILGITEWRRRAEDRKEWRRLLREASAQKGL